MCNHSIFEKSSGFSLSAANPPNTPPHSSGFSGGSPATPASHSASIQLSVDVKIAQLAANYVLRHLGSSISEPMQLNMLHELASLFNDEDTEAARRGSDPSLASPSRGRARSRSIVSKLNQQQLQCTVIEISHLMSALDEASIASVPTLLSVLQTALGHKEHGEIAVVMNGR